MTSIQGNYWRRTNNLKPRDGKNMLNSCAPDLDDYTACTEGGSCTSSPVYAELDAENINHSQIPSSLIITGPSQSVSPYTVHTYTEVADAMRMAALNSSSTALLPDASYDNAAYLPTANGDQYNTRSLRHNRALALAQLGSTTPLLVSSPHHISNSASPPINHYHYTGGRQYRKSRAAYARQYQRGNIIRNNQALNNRYSLAKRHEGLYTDFPIDSPQLSTFRVPYSFNLREVSKRPLPPLPGVRL